jgi:cytochrome P450
MRWCHSDFGRALHHHKDGKNLIVVSPNMNELFITDAAVTKEISSKWKLWTKPDSLYKIFDIFGKNVNSVNGEDWQRHRKISGVEFREENYRLTWNENRRQAKQLLETIAIRKNAVHMKELKDDLSLLAMHVLSGAAFGKSYDYEKGMKQVDAGHQLSFFAAMSMILQDMMGTVLFSSLSIPDWLLPASKRRLKPAIHEFRSYLAGAVAERRLDGISTATHDLASLLLWANDTSKGEQLKSGGKLSYLSDDELYGNMFIYSLAGFETTAMSFSFALPYLAAHPEIQEWVKEEVKALDGTDVDQHGQAFPYLPRSLAVMVRNLCSPVPADE